jgi:uncharacterized glyoxalase superfamily protein PhnB
VTPPTDQVYGERFSRLVDPVGYVWLIGHAIEARVRRPLRGRRRVGA